MLVRVCIGLSLDTGQEAPSLDATIRLQFTGTTSTWGWVINILKLKPDCGLSFQGCQLRSRVLTNSLGVFTLMSVCWDLNHAEIADGELEIFPALVD
ncbi:hypothetical protein D3C71_1921050 [compost metagenome]